ncbi:MAG: IreB family regulatory phosphoprotein [Bacilli bacterium]|nr:IreB family regulatory phosphoprotein [Bacilli bacterium]
MGNEKTSLYNVKDLDSALAREILDEVYESLNERGYNPTNQIVGYLISGDPGYISSYNNARKKIQEIDRSKIVEILLDYFYENNK